MPKNEQLRQHRIRNNWRQRNVAEQLDISITTVRRWEQGTQQPSPYYCTKLCDLFGLSAAELGLEDTAPSSGSTVYSDPVPTQPDPGPLKSNSCWTVPYLRNPYFTGRNEVLRLLEEHLLSVPQDGQCAPRRTALTQPQAVTGLGGIGKTQIAVEYAYRMREQGMYTHVLWINAASEETILTSFNALAALLPTLSLIDETDLRKRVEAVKRWLEECPSPWLLIFDNADDLSSIQLYFPHYGNGSILLTTRVHAIGSLAVTIEVETMGFVEGTHLLLRRAQRFAQPSDDEVNAAGNLVVALDHFPLALEQAGAYIEETACSFAHYLQLYQTYRHALLARRGRQASNYPDSVATTWLLSLQKVQQANPAAAELLHLCVFLAPDRVPEEFLKTGASHWPPLLRQAVADPLTFDHLLETLLSFSLIKRLTEDQLLSIHRLVQIVQLEMISPEEQPRWVERVVRATNELFPQQSKEDVTFWPQCLRYLEQVQACSRWVQHYRLIFLEAADLLERAGTYLRDQASYTLAEALYQQALHICEALGEASSAEVVRISNNAGYLYYEQGKYEQARECYQRALSLQENLLDGLSSLEGTSILKNLGTLYAQQGKYEQAEEYYQRTLASQKRALGTQHPNTAGTLTNLGLLYYKQGKYEQTRECYQQALVIEECVLGIQHPDTANTLNNLGMLYWKQEKYEQAEGFYLRALAIKERVLGTQHPGTATTLGNLGILYDEQGKYEQAEQCYQRALTIKETVLGTQHPAIAVELNNLGNSYYDQGKYQQAEPLFIRALAIKEHALGAQHPEIASTLSNLAEVYSHQGKYQQAEPLFTRALSLQRQALTFNHPDHAWTLHAFARLQEEREAFQAAADLYQQALSIREQVYGPDHPRTSETRERLDAIRPLVEKEGEAVYRSET